MYLARGAVYVRMGKIKESLADRDEAVKLAPANPQPYIARGGSYHLLGSHEEGLADRTEAIRLNPDLAEAWCARGSAYYLLGKYEFAVVDLRQALRLQPAYREASDVLKLTEARIAGMTAEDRAKQTAAPLTTREAERVQQAMKLPQPVAIAAREPVAETKPALVAPKPVEVMKEALVRNRPHQSRWRRRNRPLRKDTTCADAS